MAWFGAFVGRESELERFQSAMAAAAAGSGSVLLLGGEAGVGKSALVAAGARGGRAGTGYCTGLRATPAFGPWTEAVSGLAGQIGLPLQTLPAPFGSAGGQWTTGETAAALAGALAGREGPLLIVLEDLQWTDPESLELLRHITRRIDRLPLLLVGTYRTDGVSRQHPLWLTLPELERTGAQRLLLDRLSPESVLRWVAQALPGFPRAQEWADSLFQRTGGNPLFVRELLAFAQRRGRLLDLGEPLPETVQQAVDLRLAVLTPPARRVLQMAAVIGERFQCDLLAAALAIEEEVLEEALQEAADLHAIRPVTGHPDTFAFDHALVREVVLGALLGPRRRRLHAAVADGLLAAPRPDLFAVAFHLQQAGDPRSAEAHLTAGSHALTLQATQQACQLLGQALDLLPPDHPLRGEVLLKLGSAWPSADYERRWSLLAQAVEAARSKPVLAWARYQYCLKARWTGTPCPPETLAELEQMQAALLDDPEYRRLEADLFGEPAGFPRAAALHAQTLAARGQGDQALALLESYYRTVQAESGRFQLLNETVWIRMLSGSGEAAVASARSLADLSLRIGRHNAAIVGPVMYLYALLLYELDRPEEVDAAARRVGEMEAKSGEYSRHAMPSHGLSHLTSYWFLRGRWEEAAASLDDWLRKQSPFQIFMWRYFSVQLKLAQGDLSGARAALVGVAPHGPGDPPPDVLWDTPVYNHIAHAQIELADGNPAAAEAWLGGAERWISERGHTPDLSLIPLTRARIQHSRGHLNEAWRLASLALALAEERRIMLSLIAAHRELGELAAALDRPDQARAHLGRALALAEQCRLPYEAALTVLARARRLPAAPEERSDLERAAATLARLGAAPAAGEAEALLRRPAGQPVPGDAGAPGAQVAHRLPDGLSEREVEVIRLVAGGLTDREIAAQLYISHRTVDAHLRNIFNKAGLSSRAALAAYAVQRGLF